MAQSKRSLVNIILGSSPPQVLRSILVAPPGQEIRMYGVSLSVLRESFIEVKDKWRIQGMDVERWVRAFYMWSKGSISQVALQGELQMDLNAINERFARIAQILSVFYGARVNFNSHERNTRLEGQSIPMMNGRVVVILDGSGTATTMSVNVNQLDGFLYCFWKKQHQYRWFIAVDVEGRVLFVSDHYPGKVGDDVALRMYENASGKLFVDALLHAYPTHPRRRCVASGELEVVLCGDAGYRTFRAVHSEDGRLPLKIFVTMSALKKANANETEDLGTVDGSDLADGAATATAPTRTSATVRSRAGRAPPNVPSHLFPSPAVAPLRSVVERSIGRLKAMSHLIRGPTSSRRCDRFLGLLLPLYAGVLNTMIDNKETVLLRESEEEEDGVE